MSDSFRARVERRVRDIQDGIAAGLAALDGGHFREDDWVRPEGGGGRSRVLEGGRVLEKAGVNRSTVWGRLDAGGLGAATGESAAGPAGASFYATGVSVVIHPANPHVPIAHCNFRYFEREPDDGSEPSWWFGGGADLTPAYLYEEDATHFHRTLKAACDRHDPAYYPRFKRWCDEYFLVRHRGECRGVGGVFFDHLASGGREAALAFVRDCAGAFLPAYLPIVERRLSTPYGAAERRWQELRRGRYVEFNLVWDRGTSFGLATGARTESVLMSLPPTARWEVEHRPTAGSEEARLLEVLRHPRDWA